MGSGVDLFSKVSGISKPEMLSLWEQVKANSAKLNSCPRHKFSGDKVKIGQKMTCERCGGTMSLTDIGGYIRGYEAAGKSCDDIWPGFRDAKS